MSQDVKRIRVFHLSELLCPRGLLVADESPMPDHNSELLPVTEHESIVAELKAENERLKRALVDIANKNTCWRLYQIDKYKSYEDGWEGVAEFAGKVLKELEAIEKGKGLG